MNRRPQVHLTIDTLALPGFDARQRAALVAALQSELARQLAHPDTHAALRSSRSLASLKLPPLNLAAGADARQIAAQSTRALVQGLAGPRPASGR